MIPFASLLAIAFTTGLALGWFIRGICERMTDKSSVYEGLRRLHERRESG